MKILLVQNLIYVPTLNGASKANRHMLEGLAARGITCRVVAQAAAGPGPEARATFLRALGDRGLTISGSTAHADIFHDGGVEVHAVREAAQFRSYLMQQIRDFDPSWTIVSSEDPGQTLLEAALKVSPSRVIYLTHTSQMLPCGPHGFLPSESRTELLRQSAGIIVVSQFLKDYVKRWSGCDSVVVSPPVYGAGPFPRYGRFDDGYITMVNPCAVKGLPIFLELARRAADAPFAAVPTWGTTDADRAVLAAVPNIRLLDPADNIDEILAQTRILVAPSLWTEAFGLIVVEAMLRGIPVLASDVGGLPEAKLGVPYVLPVRPIERYHQNAASSEVATPELPEQDVTPWLAALQALLGDREHYEQLSSASREAALAFVAGVSVDPLEQFLRNLTPAASRQVTPTATPTEPKAVAGLPANLTPQQRALLALRLRKKNEAAPKPQSIPRRPRSDSAPLSFAQQRLWFLDQLEPGNVSYNIPLAVRLSGPLDLAALSQALDGVVSRHEVLRTMFAQDAHGQPVQRIAPAQPVPLPLIDLHPEGTRLPSTERDAAAREHAAVEAQKPFDLIAGPVLRATLLRLDASEHVLLLTLHHIVADGRSLDVLIHEIVTLYTAAAAGQADPLPELPIQYADYAVWQRDWLQGEVLDQQLGYWRRHLADLPTLQLPTDYPRPAVQSFQGARHALQIPTPVTQALRALSRDSGATLFMTVLAGFQTLLARYSSQHDIIVGTPVSNRSRTETEAMIGFFINTLVLRGDLSGDPSFRELLSRTREMAMQAYAHQDLPFEMLVEALQPERDLSRQPLFQITFALNKAATPAYDRGPLKLTPIDTGSQNVKFDLTLELLERADTIEGYFEYTTDLFSAATIARLAEHFQRLLSSIVADPAQRIGALELLTAAERQQLLVDWNNTTIEVPGDQLLHELVDAQAARTPDAIALTDGTRSLRYGELHRQSDLLARHLQTLGVGPGILVGVCMERSLEMIVGLLAILKAGGAYVPLDPAYPAERLQFMLDDTSAAVLLTQERLIERLRPTDSEHSAHRICLDPGWETTIATQLPPLRRTATPQDLAYIIYTSGSTGVPKGVAIAHHSAVVLMHWAHGIFTADQLAGVLAATSICFDLSVFEIFVPLSWGGSVILAENALHLPALPNADDVTLINTVPSAIAELLRSDGIPASVRTVNLAGEPLPRRIVEQLYQRPHIERVFNLYGPSEDTTYSTWTLLDRDDPRAPSIGRPVANTQIYLLDATLQPVPVGIPGELYIGGDGLARGYLNRPALTAERFVPNPFGQNPGSRLYRTGDLARYQPDGAIEYLGRVDHQIKVRGFRIELGEIEAALRQHESIRDAVVIVREETGDPRIVAYVVENKEQTNKEQRNKESTTTPLACRNRRRSRRRFGAGAGGEGLRTFLAKRLPAYMLPSAFVLLDALPLTPNGKLDRKALPLPDAARADSEQNYVAPRTPTEELLASIWAEVLHVERVGIDANFFALGGHSLLATQVIARARSAFQVDLPLRSLFETPTVAGLAAQIVAMQRQVAGNAIPPIVAVARDGGLPLSFAQQRLWFLDQLDPGTSAYNVPVAVRLSGSLDRAAIQRSIDTIVQRHETLRTVFATEHDEPVQIILPSLDVPLAVVDLQTWPEAEREREAQRLAIAEATQPFDLKTGPLVRATILLLDQHESIFLLTMHHIVSDGWSLGVFVRELVTLYSAYTADELVALPALPIQYADYASWQRNWLAGEVLEQQLAYWKDRLAGSTAFLKLPTDQPATDDQAVQGGHQSLRLPPELTQDLKQLSQREGVTLFMTLLAAYHVVLSHLTGQRDLLVGAPIANRTQPEIEGLIGFFINTLVLRADLSGNPRFRDWLDQIRATTLGAYAHQDLPFDLLVAELQPARSPGRPVLVQATFNLQNAPMPELDFAEIELRPYDVPGGATRFELALITEETPQGLLAQLHYRADLFAASTIERLLLHFQTILQAVATQPDVTLPDLFALLADADKQHWAAQQQARKATQLQKLRNIKRSALSASSNTEHSNDQ